MKHVTCKRCKALKHPYKQWEEIKVVIRPNGVEDKLSVRAGLCVRCVSEMSKVEYDTHLKEQRGIISKS